jgi:hypothetical protein
LRTGRQMWYTDARRFDLAERLADETGEKLEAAPIRVAIGTHVEVELVTEPGASEKMAFDVVPDSKADFSAGFLGAGTPLAQAILGHRAASRVPYEAADIVEVRILSVAPATSPPPGDTAASRQAVIDEAVSRSNLADTLRLALTVDVKWGDYDPDGIEANWDG